MREPSQIREKATRTAGDAVRRFLNFEGVSGPVSQELLSKVVFE